MPKFTNLDAQWYRREEWGASGRERRFFVALVPGFASRRFVLFKMNPSRAESGEDLSDEFFEASFGRLILQLGLAGGFFPGLSEPRGLFPHQANRGLKNGELPEFGPTRFLLKFGNVDAEVLVLFAKGFQLALKALVSFSVDFQLSVEVVLKHAGFFSGTIKITFEDFSGGKA